MSASQNVTNQRNNSPVVEVVALALQNSQDKKYFLARRSPGGSGAGCWEFPGGKIEPGETQQQALCREIREELAYDLNPLSIKFVGENVHAYEKGKVRIYLWRSEVGYRPEFTLLDHDATDWFHAGELGEINLSEADKPFISLILNYIKGGV